MSNPKKNKKQKFNPSDRVAVLFAGLGSVSTTLIAGVEAVKNGWGRPVGSLTQMGWVSQNGSRPTKIKDYVLLAPLNSLVFGGWDIFSRNAYESALQAKVLDKVLLEKLKKKLAAIRPMRGVFDPHYLKSLKGTHIKKSRDKERLIKDVQADISNFMRSHSCKRAVVVIAASTEIYFKKNGGVTPSQIYAEAAIKMGVPVVNATPNSWGDQTQLESASNETQAPFAGMDLKSGQTLVKTILAPGLKKRVLGVQGWFSTNILGNQDGFVLNDPGAFLAKKKTKEEVLTSILSEKEYPELYKGMTHLVNIQYYPPRGDNKEGWDNIDLYGWLDYPMQIKINFHCRDSILAAPLVLDLVLLLDLAKRQGRSGPQSWLNFYFKAPIGSSGTKLTHDLNEQHQQLQAELSHLKKK